MYKSICNNIRNIIGHFFLFNDYREAIVFLAIAILSVMGLANSVVDEESCDVDNGGCVDREIK